ncbi:MAG TPA: protein-glutamate O-methyltransferase CheR [Patescibacteria group bacterium]|nr:protein-glutamate O-methyltransferase CheR [Patescibacteria group bacterium]
MKEEDFQFYRKLLVEHSGLSLTPEKSYLLTTRLDPVARSLGHDNLEALTAAMRSQPDARLTSLVVQAMATKETSFFRDNLPFTHLRQSIFPTLLKRNSATKTVRIWSAACATGQEPYSIAIVAREFFRTYPEWNVQIIATDMAEDALAQAQEGLYSHFDIQRGLNMKTILDHFTMEGTKWRVQDGLKRLVRFGRFNLLKPMDIMGRFDVIFCRNVLIYFDMEAKKSVLERVAERLNPDGYLILGACESAVGVTAKLKPCADMPGVQTPVAPARGRSPNTEAQPALK